MDLMILLCICILLLAFALALMVRHSWVLEQNFMSYVDYNDNFLADLQAKTEQLQAFDAIVQELMDVDLQKVLRWQQMQLDLLKHQFETHNQGYYHMSEDYKLVRVTPLFEETVGLAELEGQITKAAKALGIEATLKLNRPKGND